MYVYIYKYLCTWTCVYIYMNICIHTYTRHIYTYDFCHVSQFVGERFMCTSTGNLWRQNSLPKTECLAASAHQSYFVISLSYAAWQHIRYCNTYTHTYVYI